ncbi:hypothetical protein XENOCAPTIV_006747 [Xenoophorus captivus]|uniref:Uncharacterized protein n=1 Tax=Xenoophorus captivus TaxID=1517983 RepID=A0ABV0QQF2_9TELE
MRSPQRSGRGTMAGESPLLLSLVEEFVSGLQDSKAKDASTGKQAFFVLRMMQSLTSSQPLTRARGVELLSEVLQENYAELAEREELQGLGADFVFAYEQRRSVVGKFTGGITFLSCQIDVKYRLVEGC